MPLEHLLNHFLFWVELPYFDIWSYEVPLGLDIVCGKTFTSTEMS